jgi:osmotically-inducible protein OsmY
MEKHDTRAQTLSARFPRPALLAALGLWLFCAGGCAVLPFAITTGASFAMPATASLAMSGVKGAYNTAVIASDERDVNTILRDNMLTLKAKSAVMSAKGGDDVEVLALNGDIFAVGTVESLAERDEIILAMQKIEGVGQVKGHLRLRDPEAATSLSADNSLENRAQMALSRHLLHKNSGVEVQAVEGELCLMGVVGTHAEALDLIQYLETVTSARVRSLLAIRNEYATGRSETNQLYTLAHSGESDQRTLVMHREELPLPTLPILPAQMQLSPAQRAERSAQATAQIRMRTQAAQSKPVTAHAAIARSHAIAVATPRIAQASAPSTTQPTAAAPTWNKARANMQQKLIGLAKSVQNPQAKAELLTLADNVAHDTDVSISDRLAVAAAQATQTQSKAHIEKLLTLY